MRRLLLLAALATACAPTGAYVEPASGPPSGPPEGAVDYLIVQDDSVTDTRDGELVGHCVWTYQWAEATDGVGWVAVAANAELLQPVFGGERFCILSATWGPITYQLALSSLPPGWYTVCNFEACTEPFEKT